MIAVEHAEEWLELAVSGRGIRQWVPTAYQPTLPELFRLGDNWFIRFFYYRSEWDGSSLRVERSPRYLLVYSFFSAEIVAFKELADSDIVPAIDSELLTPAFARRQRDYMECLEEHLDLLVLSGLEDGPAPPPKEEVDELFAQWLDAQPKVLRSALMSLAADIHSYK